jgi:replicative DNA helicase
MNDISLTSLQIQKTYEHVSDIENYIRSGIEYGFPSIQEMVGKMRKGQLWTVGGLSGVGKSYFILNLINNIKQYKSLNVCIFAVEMSTEEYLVRLACMREGIYKQDLYNQPHIYKNKILTQLDLISQEFPEQDRIFEIHGSIHSFEQIEETLQGKEIDLIVVDYVQMLSVNGLSNEADTMPILGPKLHRLSQDYNAIVVAVSQLNNYAINLDMSKSLSQPFSYGKQLIQASDVAIQLIRTKEEGRLSDYLLVNISKARDGITGFSVLQINPGYQLSEVSGIERADIIKNLLDSL